MSQKERQLGWQQSIIFDSETPEGRNKISALREKNPDAIIVFATGCVDVVQSGHPIMTEQMRMVGEDVAHEQGEETPETKVIVVWGLGRDSTVKALKRDPVNPQMNRAYVLASFKEVDYVVLNNVEVGEGKLDFLGVLDDLKPDVLVLNSDDSAMEIKRDLCERKGILFRTVERIVPDFLTMTSTTEIIQKIKKLR